MKYPDTIAGVITAIIGVIVLAGSSTISSIPTSDVGPSFFPKTISWLLIVFGLLLAITSFLKNNNSKELKDKLFHGGTVTTLIVIIIFGAYIVLLPILGFLLSTPLLIIGLSLFLKAKSKIGVVITGIAVTFAIYYVFLKVLLIPLPQGIIL